MKKRRRKVVKPINKNIKKYNRVKVIGDLILTVATVAAIGYTLYYCIWWFALYPIELPYIDIRISIIITVIAIPVILITCLYQTLWWERIESILERDKQRKMRRA